MRFVFLFQFFPYFFSLCRCQLRFIVHPVLEFIHHTSIWDKHGCIFQMHLFVIFCIFSFEEKSIPGFCKEFHGHGVYLCCLHSDICMLPNRIRCRQISLKSMAAFMRDHIHISACPIKICKDKGCMVIRDIGHITAHCFCFSSEYIQQLIFHHEIKEFFCLFGKLGIHPSALFQNFFRCSFWLGISFFSIDQLIRIIHMIHTQTVSSVFIQLFRKRNPVFLDLSAKIFHLFPTIAVSLHTQISQFCITVKSKNSGLFGSIFYQTVIQRIQLFLNFQEKCILFFTGAFSHFGVFAFQIWSKKGKI